MITTFRQALALAVLTALLLMSLPAAASAPDFRMLHTYALLSDAAYRAPSTLGERLAPSGYQLTAHDELPGYGVSYYVLSNAELERQIVVVRGTSNIENAMVDIAFQLIDDEHTGIKLHQGFARSTSFLYERLKPVLRKDYRTDTTGHSLGGAVALILAMYLDKDGYNVGKVITYGQPKVSNVSGSRAFDHLDVTRVVTPRDVVPLVPPVDPMMLMQLNIYWHQGVEVLLLENERYALLQGMKSIMRAGDMMVEIPSEQNLQHHMMSSYLSNLRGKLERTQQVEYQSSGFSLFGQ